MYVNGQMRCEIYDVKFKMYLNFICINSEAVELVQNLVLSSNARSGMNAQIAIERRYPGGSFDVSCAFFHN